MISSEGASVARTTSMGEVEQMIRTQHVLIAAWGIFDIILGHIQLIANRGRIVLVTGFTVDEGRFVVSHHGIRLILSQWS